MVVYSFVSSHHPTLVVMVICNHPGCKFVAAYCYSLRLPSFCLAHKQEGMSRYQHPPVNKISASPPVVDTSLAYIFTGIGQCQPEVVDVSESSSCYTNSDSETETGVCDEEVPKNPQASHCSDQLQSYQGFEMKYPKKTKTNRTEKSEL